MDDSAEEWKPVVGYEGRYEVSSAGRVRSSVTRAIKAISIHHRGYIQVDLYKAGKKKVPKVHALVAAAFIGERPLGATVNHKDGVKSNNCLQNLEYLSHRANCEHAARLGLYRKCGAQRGEKNVSAKLSEDQVLAIRYAEGKISNRLLSRIAGVDNSLIVQIHRRRIWQHI